MLVLGCRPGPSVECDRSDLTEEDAAKWYGASSVDAVIILTIKLHKTAVSCVPRDVESSAVGTMAEESMWCLW